LLTKEQLAEESDKLISGLKEKLQTLEAQQKNEKITSGKILHRVHAIAQVIIFNMNF